MSRVVVPAYAVYVLDRGLAEVLSRPAWRGRARAVALAVARRTSRHGPPPQACDYGDGCAG